MNTVKHKNWIDRAYPHFCDKPFDVHLEGQVLPIELRQQSALFVEGVNNAIPIQNHLACVQFKGRKVV